MTQNRLVAIEIRPAEADEAEVLFGVQRSSALAGFAHIFDQVQHPFPDEVERDKWASYVACTDIKVLVAEDEDEAVVVGVAVINGATLERLFVAPDRWGVGVGTRLHDAVLDMVRAEGNEECDLWVLSENTQARGFYENRGWRLDGRTRQAQFPPFPPAVGYTIDLT